MKIFNFRSCKQKANQSLDEYVTELRRLARNCDFANTDGEILSQVIQHCKSSRLRKRALRETDKSLTDILELGRSLELSDKYAATIDEEAVNVIESRKSHGDTTRGRRATHNPDTPAPKSRQFSRNRQQRQSCQKTCRNCGGEYPHNSSCPAKGKNCNYCRKENHFKSVCLKLKSRKGSS